MGLYACVVYLVASLVTFVLVGIDKHRAKRGMYRISEKTLLTCGALFGSLGLWSGMSLFRHKTQKLKFVILSRVFFFVHVIIIVYLLISPQSIEGIIKQFY